MDEERLPVREPEDKTKQPSGDYLWRVLKPGGCVLVLVLMVVLLIFCFTKKGDPVSDYAPAQSVEYYAAHSEELANELEENLLKFFPGAQCREADGLVLVSAPEETLARLKSVLAEHFDESLFIFENASE